MVWVVFIGAASTTMLLINGICLLGILPMTFLVSMDWGPKLFLPAVIVGVIFFLWTWLGMGDIVAMFDLYMMKPLLWFLVIDAILMLVLGKFNFGMLTFHGAIVSILMVLVLFNWTKTDKHPIPDLSQTAKIEIQNLRNDMHVVYDDPTDFMDVLYELEETRFVGSYWEKVDYQNWQQIFRLSCVDENEEEIVTVHFITHEYLLMEYKDRIIAYATPYGGFPAETLIEMHDAILPPA